MECYSNLKATRWIHCSGARGFRTCFTKYDTSEFSKYITFQCTSFNKSEFMTFFINLFVSGGAVTARGCSTKDKIFHIECENHVIGRTSESFVIAATFCAME